MKKLRSSKKEKELFINSIIEKLNSDNATYLEDFDIDDIKKEFSEVPKEVEKPTIQVTSEAYVKMVELIMQSSTECSWHGLVHRYKNTYFVYDVLVFPQINSPTATTTDENEFAKWQTDLIMDPDFPIEHLRLHGHSHVNMGVFSSGVDDKYQKDLITKVDNDDYYIFFIMNKKMEICIFLYDFKQQIMFEKSDLNFEIVSGIYDEETKQPIVFEEIKTWAEKELKEKATTERQTYYKNNKKEIEVDDEPAISYFSRTRPIFGGIKNGFK